jgi:hypothetical protein
MADVRLGRSALGQSPLCQEGSRSALRLNVACGSKADKPSPAKIQRCPLLSDSDQITDPAALPYTLTHSESWSRFRVWWLACGRFPAARLQRSSLSHGGANYGRAN